MKIIRMQSRSIDLAYIIENMSGHSLYASKHSNRKAYNYPSTLLRINIRLGVPR